VHLAQIAMKGDVDTFLADATLYLELFGLVAIAWQWLLQGIGVRKAIDRNASGPEEQFYQGKLVTMRYFFHYELPKIRGLAARLMEADGLTVNMDKGLFAD
jgi:hypothetical protein